MNFLKNPVSSIGNALEINNLKSKRDELKNQKKELETICSKLDDQNLLNNSIPKIIQANNEIITNLRNIFTKSNVKYDVVFEEFALSNPDPDYQMYKKLYDQLIESNKTTEQSIKHLEKCVCIDKNIHIDKINKIDEQIEKINEKLNKVREKQFGK